MLTVKDIKSPIAKEMKLFEEKFRSSMKSRVPLLDKITHYIVKRKGKQMRPMFVFLSAKMCGGITESSYTVASLIELLHTATLVHDDVVDDSSMRRGFFSLNALWKNKIAVLVGDYLLSQGLLLAVNNEEFDQLKLVSNAVREMSEGELLQIEKARRLDITEDVYFEVIRQKTASLIATCCAAGANSAGMDKETIDKLYAFGEKVGIAFQIKDDIFDYGNDQQIGKPTGIDIKERKITLPLIYALNNCSKSEKSKAINIVKRHGNKPDKVQELIQFVIDSGGLNYAANKMNQYTSEALELLNTFDDCEAKNSLISLVEYTTTRKK